MLHLTTDVNRILSSKGVNTRQKTYICKKCHALYEFYADIRFLCECGEPLPRVYDMKRFTRDRLKYHITGETQ